MSSKRTFDSLSRSNMLCCDVTTRALGSLTCGRGRECGIVIVDHTHVYKVVHVHVD